jgi:hypothetical protein
MGKAVLFTTTETELEAKGVADMLALKKRRSIVMMVQAMHLFDMPIAPKTTDKWAVIVEEEEKKS